MKIRPINTVGHGLCAVPHSVSPSGRATIKVAPTRDQFNFVGDGFPVPPAAHLLTGSIVGNGLCAVPSPQGARRATNGRPYWDDVFFALPSG